MKREKGGILWYLYFHSILEGYAGSSKILPITKVTELAGRYRLPRPLRYPLIEEMKKMGLLESHSQYEVKLINCSRNKIITDYSKVNHRLGLF